jgi:hypothetical protein
MVVAHVWVFVKCHMLWFGHYDAPIYSGLSNTSSQRYPQPVYNSISQSDEYVSQRGLGSLQRLSEDLYIGAILCIQTSGQGVSIGVYIGNGG